MYAYKGFHQGGSAVENNGEDGIKSYLANRNERTGKSNSVVGDGIERLLLHEGTKEGSRQIVQYDGDKQAQFETVARFIPKDQ